VLLELNDPWPAGEPAGAETRRDRGDLAVADRRA
jgi:hypothetical protein